MHMEQGSSFGSHALAWLPRTPACLVVQGLLPLHKGCTPPVLGLGVPPAPQVQRRCMGGRDRYALCSHFRMRPKGMLRCSRRQLPTRAATARRAQVLLPSPRPWPNTVTAHCFSHPLPQTSGSWALCPFGVPTPEATSPPPPCLQREALAAGDGRATGAIAWSSSSLTVSRGLQGGPVDPQALARPSTPGHPHQPERLL